MRSKPVAFLLTDLGIMKTQPMPYTSKKLGYCPILTVVPPAAGSLTARKFIKIAHLISGDFDLPPLTVSIEEP